jgi:Right handed beta helix region
VKVRWLRVLSAAAVTVVLTGCFPTPPPDPGPRTFFVRPGGDDGAPGTSTASAWRTIGRVNQADLEPGDTVAFEGSGTYHGELKLFAEDSGTDAERVVVTSYGEGRAAVAAGDGVGITSYNSEGITLEHLAVVGSGFATNDAHGVQFYNDLPGDTVLGDIRVEDVRISGFGHWGLLLGSDVGRSGYADVRILDVDSSSNGEGGILTWGAEPGVNTNVRIRSSTAAFNPGRPDLTRNSGNGIVLGNVNGGAIEDSVAHHNGGANTAGEGPVGIWAYDATRVALQRNESYANRTGSAADGGGFDLDQNVTDSVVQHNYSHDNEGPGFLLAHRYDTAGHAGNVVRYNISQDDARKGSGGAFAVWGEIRDTDVHHNVVFARPPASGAISLVSVTNGGASAAEVHEVRFWDNVFVVDGGVRLLDVSSSQVAAGTGLRFEGNDWWGGAGGTRFRWAGTAYTSLAEWQAATGQERDGDAPLGRSVDPGMVGPGNGPASYRLLAGSPLVDAGLPPSRFGADLGGRDFFGGDAPLGPAPDVGAHELR